MIEHLFKNWIVYILLAGFIWFVAFVYIRSHKEEKQKEHEQTSGKGGEAGRR